MAADQRELCGQFSVADVLIGVAEASGSHANQDFSGTDLGFAQFDFAHVPFGVDAVNNGSLQLHFLFQSNPGCLDFGVGL